MPASVAFVALLPYVPSLISVQAKESNSYFNNKEVFCNMLMQFQLVRNETHALELLDVLNNECSGIYSISMPLSRSVIYLSTKYFLI